eukprot:6247176-Pyramimonas_sp.AAC.1
MPPALVTRALLIITGCHASLELREELVGGSVVEAAVVCRRGAGHNVQEELVCSRRRCSGPPVRASGATGSSGG